MKKTINNNLIYTSPSLKVVLVEMKQPALTQVSAPDLYEDEEEW